MNLKVWGIVFILFVITFLIPFVKAEPQNFGVFDDLKATKQSTSIDWGTIPNGGYVSRTVYVKNFWEASYIGFSLRMINVEPEGVEEFLRLEGNMLQFLDKNGVSELELTLYVDSKNKDFTSFDFDIVIYADYFAESTTLGDSSVEGTSSPFDSGSGDRPSITIPQQSYTIEDPPFTISGDLMVIVGVGVVCFYIIGKERR